MWFGIGRNGLDITKEQADAVIAELNSGYAKAFAAGALTDRAMEQRAKSNPAISVSYLRTLRTAEYGDRIRLKSAHAMPEKGIMLQVTEVGGYFYFDWYQGFHDDKYVKAMRDIMKEAGMNGTLLERVE